MKVMVKGKYEISIYRTWAIISKFTDFGKRGDISCSLKTGILPVSPRLVLNTTVSLASTNFIVQLDKAVTGTKSDRLINF